MFTLASSMRSSITTSKHLSQTRFGGQDRTTASTSLHCPSNTMGPYPTKPEIEELCAHLSTGNQKPFFDRVSQNVVWDVLGTHPAAGHFTSLGLRLLPLGPQSLQG